MNKITDGGNVFLGVIAQAFTISSNLLLTLILFRDCLSDEIAVHFSIWQFMGLVYLIDFGLSSTVSRDVAKMRVDSFDLGREYLKYFGRVRFVYNRIALLAVLLLFVGMCIYYTSGSSHSVVYNTFFFILYISAVFINVKYLYFGALFKGMSAIGYAYISTIIARGAQIVLILIFCNASLGIILVPMSYFAYVVVLRLSSNVIYKKKIIVQGGLDGISIKLEFADVLKQGVISILAFFQDRSVILLIALFMSSSFVAKYGFLFQILSVISVASNLLYNTRYSSLVVMLSSRNNQFWSILLKTLIIQLCLNILLAVIAYFFVLVVSKHYALPTFSLSEILLGSIFFFIVSFTLIIASMLIVLGDYSYRYGQLFTVILLSCLVFWIAQEDLVKLLGLMILSQIVFSVWYYPTRLFRKFYAT